MNRSLSLAQVREAAVFAWHPQGYLLVDGELLRAVRMEPPASGGHSHILRVGPTRLRGSEHMLSEGWRHLKGCDCRFCAEGIQAGA